ncbi:MAG: hypothetical protein NMK33_05920 (plasmid) [Candidatus Cardinium sp.]|uniref:hypothetical protein n=1 Tax=Cardinium endosymbiont of Dermatophagoides farinae TaxID=2597823 RepID=UPI0016433E46|nr:hypothetical protein [Cardinium endosymbiont of Dermatophagoides farinae]UWW97584.1 MAG: hypothetical protein NMK33_05920 [Candidatus Cardinium sp.]
MEDKIKIIVSNLVRAGINMNAFLKVSGISIKEKIEEVTRVYFAPTKKSKYTRKALKY